MTFHKAANGGIRAYIHARENTSQDTLNTIICKLQEAGMQCIPYSYDGNPALEVRGFKNESRLVASLQDKKWVSGEARIQNTTDDHVSFADKLKKNTLQASGIFYLLGDACYATYGYKKGHWEDMLAGLFYLCGSSSLVGYGQNDLADLQIKDIAKKIESEVDRQGAALPDNCSLRSITNDYNKGLLSNTNELLRRYPSETMNTFFGLAGACIAASAFRHHILHPSGLDAKAIRENTRAGWMDVGLGTMTMAAGAVSALVKEKARDPDDPLPTTVVGKVKDFIQHKPLSVAGMGYIISTLCHAASTRENIKTARRTGDMTVMKSVPYRAAFVGLNIVAEVLMAFSSKGHGEGVVSDVSVDESALAITADLIARQPREMQEHLIEYMAGFLGKQEVLAMKNEEIIAKLHMQVETMHNNPWAHALTSKSPTQSRPSVPAPNQDIIPFWQAKQLHTEIDPTIPIGRAG